MKFKDNNKVIYETESGTKYTGSDFFIIAKENETLANAIFKLCDWQRPETVFQELLNEEEINEQGEILCQHSYMPINNDGAQKCRYCGEHE